MQLTKEKRGECSILLVHGRLDGTTSPKFEAEVLGWLSGGGKAFVLDMAGISFMSSAALRVLLSMAKRVARTGGKVVLSSPNAVVSEVFEISNFSAMFTICPTLDEGVAAANQGPAASAPVTLPTAAPVPPKPAPVTPPIPPAPIAPPTPPTRTTARTEEMPPVVPPQEAPSLETAAPTLLMSVAQAAETSPLAPVVPTLPAEPKPKPVAASAPAPVPVAPAAPPRAPVAPPPLPAPPPPAPAPVAKKSGPRKLELVVGTHVVECRDGDVIGSEGTVARHLFKSAASLQPRHILIGKGPDAWFVMVPRNVQITTHLDSTVLAPGVRQNLSDEHQLAVGDFVFSLRLSEGRERSVNDSFFKRLFKILNLD